MIVKQKPIRTSILESFSATWFIVDVYLCNIIRKSVAVLDLLSLKLKFAFLVFEVDIIAPLYPSFAPSSPTPSNSFWTLPMQDMDMALTPFQNWTTGLFGELIVKFLGKSIKCISQQFLGINLRRHRIEWERDSTNNCKTWWRYLMNLHVHFFTIPEASGSTLDAIPMQFFYFPGSTNFEVSCWVFFLCLALGLACEPKKKSGNNMWVAKWVRENAAKNFSVEKYFISFSFNSVFSSRNFTIKL